MDQWVQKLSVLVILLTAAATLYSSRQGASCWCPSHFTQSNVDYTETWCSTNASTHYPIIPPNSGAELPTTHGHQHQRAVALLGENTALLKYLAGELILVCALYSLIKCITRCTTFDVLFAYDLHRSYSKAPAYILVQLSGCAIWVLFAILTYTGYSPELLNKPAEPFLCAFQIRHQARMHKWVIQCVDGSEGGMKMAVMTNMGLCVVVAFSKLVHIVAVFGIQPLLKVDKVATKMVERRVIEESSEMSLGFGLSDLYFAILVSGRDITPFLIRTPQYQHHAEDQLRQKPPYSSPYNSRPVSMIS